MWASLIEGWLNIDNYESTEANYHRLNLLDKHPFRKIPCDSVFPKIFWNT